MSGSYYTNNNERMWLTINGEKVMYDEPMRTAGKQIKFINNYLIYIIINFKFLFSWWYCFNPWLRMGNFLCSYKPCNLQNPL